MRKITLFLPLVLMFFLCRAQNRDELFYQGLSEMETGRYDEAINRFSEALRLSGVDPLLYMKRGEAYFLVHQYNQAIEDLKKAAEYEQKDANYLLAQCYSLSGDFSSAVFSLEKYLRSGDKLSRNVIMNNQAFTILKTTKEWERLWENEWYSKEDIVLEEAKNFLDRGKTKQALSVLDELLLSSPDFDKAFALRAEAFFFLNDFYNALDDYTRAIKKNDKNAAYYSGRAKTNMQLKKYKNALNDYTSAIQHSPCEMKLYYQRALAAYEGKHYEGALNDLQKFISCFPGDAEAIYHAGEICFHTKQYNLAIDYLSRSIELNQTNAGYYALRGKVYIEAESYHEADQDFAMSLDLDPNQPEVYCKKGIAKYNLGEKQSACYCWNKAISMGNVDAAFFTGQYCR